MPRLLTPLMVLTLLVSFVHAAPSTMVDAGAPFGELPLIDEVICGQEDAGHSFEESPAGASSVQEILGQPCRVLKTGLDEGSYFAYRIGQGKGLKAGAAYVLQVEYPEDTSRSLFIRNRGGEMTRGLATGAALQDVLYDRYVNPNPESLKIPLSGKYETTAMLFFMHDRTTGIKSPRDDDPRPFKPEDGFYVIINQTRGINHPVSAGAAVSRIRLFEVPDVEKYYLKINFPPAELPQRHLFWREEMSDGVVGSAKPEERGVTNPTDWFEYKAKLSKFLGMNTFSKDLLEFGHNQGWDSAIYGGSEWVNQNRDPQRWSRILEMLGKYDLNVLPYYEWAGSIGQNKEMAYGIRLLCRPLGETEHYTHISWCWKGNADLTDDDAREDLRKILEATITRHKDKVNFVGAWLRPRPEANPVSFSDRCLAEFAADANDGTTVTREQLQADKELYARYMNWWFGERREFLEAMRDYLRGQIGEDAVMLYTTDHTEGGWNLPGPGAIVTDDVATWTEVLARPGMKKMRVLDIDDVIANKMHLEAMTSPRGTWAEWEWQHACPQADPQNYADADGVLLTLTINRAYTVGSPETFDAFRTPSGLAVLRHYSLSENCMDNKTGYFVADTDRAGAYAMLPEAWSMAYGDPRFIGYLASNSFSRNFPQYARQFNAAFLSLPALPSKVLEGAADDKAVVVRAIETEKHGTYLAVVNTGFESKQVTVTLPAEGKLTNAATSEELSAGDGKVELKMHPCQLISLHIAK